MKHLDAFNPLAPKKPVYPRGSGGGKGGGGGGSQEDPTSLQSNQIASLVDLLCEGPIQGFVGGFNAIRLNNTPLQNADGSWNFQGATVNYKYGYPNDQPLPGMNDTEQVFQLTQKILHAIPYTVQLSATNVDAVVLTIGVQGLLQTDTSNGDIHGTSVQFHVDVQPAGGAWYTAFSDTISGKTNSNYSRDYRLELPASQGPWSVRVTKDTADSTATTLLNDLYFNSYTEIGELNLSYPYSAMVALSLSAQQFGTSVPSRAYLIQGMILQVPSNYDPATRTYAGAYWDGTFKSAWSDNPAWVMYDIMTNARYGLGKRLNPALIDKYALYNIAQYCDQYVPDGYGGWEPRFRFNGVLQQAQDAYQVLQSIASTMRGMIYWSAGAITFTQDSPKTVTKLFAPANVINGQFDYQSSALKDRHSVARVVWNDPNNYYQQAVEVVEHPDAMNRFGWRSIDIQAIGTTSRGQAHRIGKWYLDTEFSEAETVTFSCSLQEADLMPGALIEIADPSVAGGRFGGRVVSNTGQKITVDAPVQLFGNDLIMVIAPDGQSVWQMAVTSNDGKNPTQNLLLAAPFSAAVQPGAMFLMSSPTLTPRQFRVVSNTETAKNVWQIQAVFYDPTKFARIENDIYLPQPNYSILPTGPLPSPTGVVVSESLFQQNNSLVSRVSISWSPASDARVSEYDVYAQAPGGNMAFYGTTQVCAFDIDTVQTGNWAFQVYSRGLTGVSLTPATATYQVLGKNAPPSDVASLSYTFNPTLGVTLTWPGVPDVDLALYEIRQDNQYSDGDWDIATYIGQVKGSEYTLGPGFGGGTFMVKAISTQGNYSLHDASCKVIVPVADAPTVGGSFVGPNAVLTWNVPNSTFAIDHYEVRTDTHFGTPGAALLGTVKGTTFSLKAQWSGPKTFYIAAYDSAGDYGAAGALVMSISLPSQPQISEQTIDNNVLLRWNNVTSTLPIDHYEVRKGATWAAASVVGTISGTFDTLFETVQGTYTYWVCGVDSAGNYGTPGSVAATVNQPPDYVLLYNLNSTFSGAITNGAIDTDGSLVVPIDTTTTFEEHFLRAGGTNILAGLDNQFTTQWSAADCTITGGQTDPWGGATGFKVSRTAAGNDYLWRAAPAAEGNCAGKQYTFGVWLKRGTETNASFTLRLRDSNSTEVAAPTVTVTNAWQFFTVTGTFASNAVGAALLYIDPNDDTGAAGDSFYVWGDTLAHGASAAVWNSPNDQINAGYPLYIEPGTTSATYVETIDYGALLPSTKFTVTPTYAVMAGNPTVNVDVKVSADNTNWTDYPNLTTPVYVTGFRYAKVTITVTGAGGDILRMTGLNIRFDVKQKNDGGTIYANASDANGTNVNFSQQFIDVQSITLAAAGTVAMFPIYAFNDAPYPTNFQIYLFDKNGNRVSGTVSWTARGV